MAMDMSGINSFVNKIQMQNAQQVTQSMMGSLKSNKEIKNEKPPEETSPEWADEVSLSASVTPEQEMAAAENSGDLAQVDPQLKNKDNDRVEAGRQHALHLAEEGFGQGLNEAGELDEENDPSVRNVGSADGSRQSREQRLIEQLLGDVPDDIKKVSGEMVTNQIKGTTPAASLARVHNIPEPAHKELDAAPMLSEPLEIHDTKNHPMPLHFEEAPL